MNIDFTNLSEVLTWLGTGAGMVAVAVALSDLMRNIKADWWVKQDGKIKLGIMLGLYLIIGAGAFAVSTYVDPALLAQLQPFWSRLTILFLSGRVFFEVAKS